jgi:hypothetical protein
LRYFHAITISKTNPQYFCIIGTYFGEMALLADDVRKATVTSFTNCECFVLDRGTLNTILEVAKDDIQRETTMRMKSVQDRQDAAYAQVCILYIIVYGITIDFSLAHMIWHHMVLTGVN